MAHKKTKSHAGISGHHSGFGGPTTPAGPSLLTSTTTLLTVDGLASTRGQYYQFIGRLTNGSALQEYWVEVLAGNGAPTITDGFARWAIVDRPQRVGMTVLQGYNPIVMEVPILFDCVMQREANQAPDIEYPIQALEWMGGRGKLYTQVGHPGQGDSPLVSLYSANAKGAETPLIPLNCQDLDWVITSISYDTGALRNPAGGRIRQAATVTLTQHVNSPGTSFDSPSTRAKVKQKNQDNYATYRLTQAHNTIRKITTFDALNPKHSAAVTVLNFNKKRLHLGPSVDADLTKQHPIGTKIRVPFSVISG